MIKKFEIKPDEYNTSPLFSLLKSNGSLVKLKSYTNSLFARHENVSSLIEDLEKNEELPENEKDILRKHIVEKNMLKQVLDWLTVDTDSKI